MDRQILTARHVSLWTLLLLIIMLNGCGQNADQTAAIRELKPIAAGDECHVCGMLISGFPGPKGQAFIHNRTESLKFCSTVDLFNWLLQPETQGVLDVAYVQDMTTADWENTDKAQYVDARNAWYVIGHDLRGAMGPTLVSFATQAAAEDFAHQHGGRVLTYAQIDLEALAQLRDVVMPDIDGGTHQH